MRWANVLRSLGLVAAGAALGGAAGFGVAWGVGAYCRWEDPQDPSSFSGVLIVVFTFPAGLVLGAIGGAYCAERWMKSDGPRGFDLAAESGRAPDVGPPRSRRHGMSLNFRSRARPDLARRGYGLGSYAGTKTAADTYDEDAELVAYVWRYFPQFLTSVESVAGLAHAVDPDTGEARFSPKYRMPAFKDPAVLAALRDGVEPFRLRTARRIVADHPAEVPLNRCARCSRLARTPKARQCFWCGHDWH